MGKKEAVLTFESTHQAILAEKLLKEGNIPLRVMALPAQIEAGCGLCIRLEPEDCPKALAVLVKGGAPPEGAYLKTIQKGTIEYTPMECC